MSADAETGALGTLFVVATPIGNLEDITMRALRVLREVALIAAEDTRRTGNLLRHFGIATRLMSLHQHNEQQRVPVVLKWLASGQSVALVTDAGTPGISDPGALLVRAVRSAGGNVVPVPGPSALTAALSVSGLSTTSVLFEGFLPLRLKDKEAWLARIRALPDSAVVLFEAPHRINGTLTFLHRHLADRSLLVFRELTKLHEECLTFAARSSAAERQSADHPSEVTAQGELVIVLEPSLTVPALQRDPPLTDTGIKEHFERWSSMEGGSKRARIKGLAAQLGISPNAVYDALERTKSAATSA